MVEIKLEKILEVALILDCFLVIITSFFSMFIQLFGDFQRLILSAYFILFSLILIAGIFNVKKVTDNFHLLGSVRGRGIFTLILGTLLLNSAKYQLITSIITIGIGFMIIISSILWKSEFKNSNNLLLDQAEGIIF